nr:unnamed protein product [Callosobruchus chinensis]
METGMKISNDFSNESNENEAKVVAKKKNEMSSHISVKEFLNYLKTAYQLQDNDNGDGILMSGGMKDAVDWLKSKENQELLRINSICCQTSDSLLQEDKKDTRSKKSGSSCSSSNHTPISNISEAEPLKNKLSEVLSEGLLDSVLPYLVQNAANIKKNLSVKLNEKLLIQSSSQSSSEKVLSKKSSGDSSCKLNVIKTDSEVEIHVCDEVKNMKKTFVCNQKLLVEKMGYFAEVTLGQRLEDMDISVHCDIGIFEWLMQWVKKDSLLEEDWPKLDPQCVIPILVSAAFLQMEPLLNDCLLFCHEHMNEILRTSTNLSCLNDSVLTRLAAMYTNTEVEAIKDRKDKIQSRLFTKLIMSLGEPDAESVRGHWCSLASLFKCEKCHLLITPHVAPNIPCIPSCMRLQPDGSVVSLHIRDQRWSLNDHIVHLRSALKSWRRVYWRLWGSAHFLFCAACRQHFPCSRDGWCRHHPDPPQFFATDAGCQKPPLPVGRYPCCGERAYRFKVLDEGGGCQFRQHMVCSLDIRESAIYSMLESYRNLIEEEPPQLLFPERLTRLVARDPNTTDKKFVCKETFWWEGFEIIPPRPKFGLLSGFSNRAKLESSSEESTEELTEEESSTSSSESEDGSAESNPPPARVTISRRKVKKKKDLKLWQHNLSARSNQDIQRAHEEHAVKEMSVILNRNVCQENYIRSNKATARNLTPMGGVWMRLESEWKDNFSQNSQKMKNVNVKMSKFRR